MSISDSDEYSDIAMTQTSEMEFEDREIKNMQKEDTILIETTKNAIDPTEQNTEYLHRKLNQLMTDSLQFFKENEHRECYFDKIPYPENFRRIFLGFQQMLEEKCNTDTTPMEFAELQKHFAQFDEDFTFYQEHYAMHQRLSMFDNFHHLDAFNKRDLQHEKKCQQQEKFNDVKECYLCRVPFILPDQLETITQKDELPCKCKHFIMHKTCQKLYFSGNNSHKH
jgi:hypothetical protein